MRMGFTLPPPNHEFDAQGLRELALAVSAGGFDHLLVLDHVLGVDVSGHPGWEGPYSLQDAFWEPFTVLSHLAAVTDLELATAVLVLPQRQTALVAKQAAELSRLCAGRFRLGVGLGWNDVEYRSLGMDFASRARRFEEQVALLRRLWTERSLTWNGSYDRIDAAGINPLPGHPPPIWFGGGHPGALQRIGRLAEGWHVPRLAPGRGFEAAHATVQDALRASGRDPASFPIEGSVRCSSPGEIDHLKHATERWARAGISHLQVVTGQVPLTLRNAIRIAETAGAALAAWRA